jgi:competence protein ComEA
MKKLVFIFALVVMTFSLAFAKVNINTASKEELASLKYVGEAKAEAIIKYRENQKFESIDEFLNVDGVGDKVFEMNKDQICVGNGDC